MDISCSSTAVTKPRKSYCDFSWTVESFESDYVSTYAGAVTKIHSPTFTVLLPDGDSDSYWAVELHTNETHIVNAILRMNACQTSYTAKNCSMIRIKFGIYAGTSSEPKIYGLESAKSFDLNSSMPSCQWPKWISFQDLREKGLLEGRCLRLRAELTIFAPPKSVITSKIVNFVGVGAAQMAVERGLNFATILKSGRFSDIKVECGREIFLAHKAILAGRLEELGRILTSNMENTHAGVISVTDVTSCTFAIILQYIYTGRLENELDSDSLYEVIYVAQKYGLKELKNYCFRKLLQCISEKNVGTLAVAAYLYAADKEIKTAVRIFVEPHFVGWMERNSEFKVIVKKYFSAFF